ncbi:MAG: site-2 protease family protein [Capsulimonadaceae bacterium]
MPEERKEPTPVPHPWSLQIATVAGIPIRLHFTFFLGLFYFASFGNGSLPTRVALTLAVFACVALHELGHCLVALHYKIPVRDITLYPIGGIASIERRPGPVQEFWIALAGPAVNVVIAGILWAIIVNTPGGWNLSASMSAGRLLLLSVCATNIVLVLFNMIPAFPMDGGRVLRAILAMKMPPARATSIAAAIGQILAIGFAVAAIVWHTSPMLMLIALFVFIGAGQEAVSYRQAAGLEGVMAEQAMMTEVRTLAVNNTLKEAADILVSSPQHDFPVMYADTVQGVLTRNGLLRGLSSEGPGAYVAGIMDRKFYSVAPNMDLALVLPHLREYEGPVLVIDPGPDGRLLGVISAENVAEFLAVRRITADRGGFVT